MIARILVRTAAVALAWREMGTARLVRAYREHRAIERARRHIVLADAAVGRGDMAAADRHLARATGARRLAHRLAAPDAEAAPCARQRGNTLDLT